MGLGAAMTTATLHLNLTVTVLPASDSVTRCKELTLLSPSKTTLPGGFFVSEQESTGSSDDRSTIFDLPLFLIAFNIIVVGVSLEIGNFCTLSTLFNQFGYVSD